VASGGKKNHEPTPVIQKLPRDSKEDKLTDFRSKVIQLSPISERKTQEHIEEKRYFIG
jgi:hypothetical protein